MDPESAAAGLPVRAATVRFEDVDPTAEVARNAVAHLEHEAALLGCRRIVPVTNGTLSEAIAMYGRAGYRSIERYNDNPYAQAWFEKQVETR